MATSGVLPSVLVLGVLFCTILTGDGTVKTGPPHEATSSSPGWPLAKISISPVSPTSNPLSHTSSPVSRTSKQGSQAESHKNPGCFGFLSPHKKTSGDQKKTQGYVKSQNSGWGSKLNRIFRKKPKGRYSNGVLLNPDKAKDMPPHRAANGLLLRDRPFLSEHQDEISPQTHEISGEN
nr:PREDICTED: uncharacterized protein LOC109038361 [Bemisia tabaci]